MINIKIIKSYRDVVAVSDPELIGNNFEEPFTSNGKNSVRQLDVKENFYRGEEFAEEDAIRIMKRYAQEDATFNIVGKKSVEVALKAEVIVKEQVGHIAGIPFALVFL